MVATFLFGRHRGLDIGRAKRGLGVMRRRGMGGRALRGLAARFGIRWDALAGHGL